MTTLTACARLASALLICPLWSTAFASGSVEIPGWQRPLRQATLTRTEVTGSSALPEQILLLGEKLDGARQPLTALELRVSDSPAGPGFDQTLPVVSVEQTRCEVTIYRTSATEAIALVLNEWHPERCSPGAESTDSGLRWDLKVTERQPATGQASATSEYQGYPQAVLTPQ